MDGDRTYIDDADPSVHYFSLSGGPNPWVSGPGAAGKEFNATTTHTAEAGAAADVTFFGSEITVYATVGSTSDFGPPPSISFSIDDGEPQTFKPTDSNQVQYDVKLYQSRGLKVAQHNLRMSIVQSGHIWLDYFLVRVEQKLKFASVAGIAGGVGGPPSTSESISLTGATSILDATLAAATNSPVFTAESSTFAIPAQVNGQGSVTSQITSNVTEGTSRSTVTSIDDFSGSSFRPRTDNNSHTSTFTSTAAASLLPSPSNSTNPSNRHGILVGLAALGGTLCFVSFLMLIWFIRKRKAKCRSKTITPFCEHPLETAHSLTGSLPPLRIPEATARAGGRQGKLQRTDSSAHLLQLDAPPEYPGLPS